MILGQQARDALLMIMQLSSRNSNLARYIVDNTDFCPVKILNLLNPCQNNEKVFIF